NLLAHAAGCILSVFPATAWIMGRCFVLFNYFIGSGDSAGTSLPLCPRGLVLVSWNPCSSHRTGASRQTIDGRSVHLYSTHRRVYYGRVGCDGYPSPAGTPKRDSGRNSGLRNFRERYGRQGSSSVLEEHSGVVAPRTGGYER